MVGILDKSVGFLYEIFAMNILSEFYELEIVPGEILNWNLEFIFVMLNYESREELRVHFSTLDLLCIRILFDHYHTLDSVA